MPFFISVCIPTFNRADYLSETVKAIISDPKFSENMIEVVVSDNASTDHTPEVMRKFAEQFPGKILYLRNETPIDSHFNFQNALDHGHGEYLKLLNDTSIFLPGMLSHLYDVLKEHKNTDVFITNQQTCHGEKFHEVKNVDEAVSYGSFFITWISSYTYRRSAYMTLKEPFRYYKYYFPQEDIYFRILEQGGISLFSNECYFKRQGAKYNSKVRNEALIYGDCYLDFLKKYLDNGQLTLSVFKREKRDVLFWHILPIYFDFNGDFFAEKHLGYKTFWKSTPQYHRCPYYYFALIVAVVYSVSMEIPGVKKIVTQMKNFVKSFTRNKLTEVSK